MVFIAMGIMSLDVIHIVKPFKELINVNSNESYQGLALSFVVFKYPFFRNKRYPKIEIFIQIICHFYHVY